MRPIPILFVALALALLVLTGCDPKRNDANGLFEEGGPLSKEEKAAVAKAIEDLALAKDLDDPDDEASYNDAVLDLTLRGSAIEYLLIEELSENQDWGVRYGVINVLDSVGTRASVEPLIAALADPHYLVAYKANHTLRVMCKHQEIPDEGEGANGLPAVPPFDPEDLDPGAQFKPWIRWHAEHAEDLRDAWRTWWKTEGNGVVID